MILLTATAIAPIFLQIAPIGILGIVSFFLVRYVKQNDSKNDSISEDLQHIILSFTTLKTEQKGWIKILTETKTKLDDFISEMRGNMERMNDKFEKKSNNINEHVQKNNDNIIRLQEKEIQLNQKLERIENYQDGCKFKNIKK